MRMRSTIGAVFVAALTLGLTGCPGGDSTGVGDQIDLTVAQVNDVSDAIQAISAVGGATAPDAEIAFATATST